MVQIDVECDPVLPDADYLRFLHEGRFMIQRSRKNETFVFYPRVAEPRAGTEDLEWVPASGLGTVYSTTVISAKPPEQNYNVALVDLDEGPRMMSCVVDIKPEAVKIGMRVVARIEKNDGGQPRVVFAPYPRHLSLPTGDAPVG